MADDVILVPKLTKRECEIMTLMAWGLKNKEIALRLSISEATVENHIHHVFQKLQVSCRSQAILRAFQIGIVHPEEILHEVRNKSIGGEKIKGTLHGKTSVTG